MTLKIQLTGTGLFREILELGICSLLNPKVDLIKSFRRENNLLVVEPTRPNELGSDFARVLSETADHLRSKVDQCPGSKLGRNDKTSYAKSFENWFGVSQEGIEKLSYPYLFIRAIELTADLLRSGKINPSKSLSVIKLARGKVVLGVEPEVDKGTLFITPSVIKQIEFFEKSTNFLKPTTGPSSMVKMDPLWFSLLCIGFLRGYAGFYGGAYHIITHPLAEIAATPREVERVLNTVRAVSFSSIERRRSVDSEEVYELGLSFGLAERVRSLEELKELLWPVKMYREKIIGRAFTADKVIELDLEDLVSFCLSYIRALDEEIKVEIKDGKYSPMEALVIMAERELYTSIGGDNELIAYLTIKDIHRAIKSGSRKYVEETLSRVLRRARVISHTRRVNALLKCILEKFSYEENLEAILEAIKCPTLSLGMKR